MEEERTELEDMEEEFEELEDLDEEDLDDMDEMDEMEPDETMEPEPLGEGGPNTREAFEESDEDEFLFEDE